VLFFVCSSAVNATAYKTGKDRLTNFKLCIGGAGISIKAENNWRGVGRPQVAMHRNCHILVRVFTALHGMQTWSAMRILSVRLSNAWIVTKRKKDLSRFLYRMKDHLA